MNILDRFKARIDQPERIVPRDLTDRVVLTKGHLYLCWTWTTYVHEGKMRVLRFDGTYVGDRAVYAEMDATIIGYGPCGAIPILDLGADE